MTSDWLMRTELLLGTDNLERLKQSNVLLVGLGGVGSWTAEFLVRSGIGNLTLVDSDRVDSTNINRQLPATQKTVGMLKTDIMQQRLLEINPELKLTVISNYIHDETIDEILFPPYDLVIDAIDTLSPKVWFLYFALKKGYRIVSSMGSGARLDPTMVRIADISKTKNCTLARSVRKRLHRMGITTGFTAVYSEEMPMKHAVIENEGRNKKSMVGSVVFVTAAFACALSSYAIKTLTGSHENLEQIVPPHS
ncbi:MAG TPA: tRNA threonylcarbamoyladenosine dehydratase [Salinivirgaceae bacterium]|nr:tRNA threonylcarbamoyladenosine dehydratase [Salinivirgaceae bacterium]